jgi:hypothetical protein
MKKMMVSAMMTMGGTTTQKTVDGGTACLLSAGQGIDSRAADMRADTEPSIRAMRQTGTT